MAVAEPAGEALSGIMSAHEQTERFVEVTPDWSGGWVLGWREIVLVLAGILVAYVLWVFFRLRRIGRSVPEKKMAAAEHGAIGTSEPPASGPIAPVFAQEVPFDACESNLPWARPPERSQDNRRVEIIESEVVSLRNQVDALRETVIALSEELRAASALGASATKSPDPLSPLYGEAMQMAVDGHDAETISARCGIARAEAELVVALARRSMQAEGGRDDDGQTRY